MLTFLYFCYPSSNLEEWHLIYVTKEKDTPPVIARDLVVSFSLKPPWLNDRFREPYQINIFDFRSILGMKLGQILRLASDPANSSLEVKKGNIEALCIHLQGALRFHERVKKVFYLN